MRLMPSSEIAHAVQWLAVLIPSMISLGISNDVAMRPIALSFIGVICSDSSDQKLTWVSLRLLIWARTSSGMVAMIGTTAAALLWSAIEVAATRCM